MWLHSRFFHAPFCPAQTRSLSSIQEDPFHTPSSHSLCSMSLSMNSLSSKSMVMSSASYDTFSTVGNKIQEMESGQAKKSSECRRVRSAPNICIERRSSPQVLKTAIMEYGGTLRMSWLLLATHAGMLKLVLNLITDSMNVFITL